MERIDEKISHNPGSSMEKVSINSTQVQALIKLIEPLEVPVEQESRNHSFEVNIDSRILENAYFAIVAICHQTSPVGERRLCGIVNSCEKYGWDYLKEKFLYVLIREGRWGVPKFWKNLTLNELSRLYEDNLHGRTLNRISERTSLLNNLGSVLEQLGYVYIFDAFVSCSQKIYGEQGFLNLLRKFEAYRDPLKKKSLFFLSIMTKEFGWEIRDEKSLPSPIDYHELRGHLRIGTLCINDLELRERVRKGQPISEEDDIELRSKAQEVNEEIAKYTGLTGSIVHYLLWNIFRNCCPIDSRKTHCSSCGKDCTLPHRYKDLYGLNRRCIFSAICDSANKDEKYVEPAYLGHYY